MSVKRLQFGDLPIGTISLNQQGLLQGTNLPTARPASAPIQTRLVGRNGKHPNAIAESMKSEAGNQAALFKTKQVFRSPGLTWPTPQTSVGMAAGAGTCNRWRCAFHSGPFANFIDVEVYATTNGSYGNASSYAQVDVTDFFAGTTQTATFPTGAIATIGSLFDMYQLQTQRIFITPDRDYTVVFSEHGSDTFFANISEFSSLTAYMGGYLPQNIAAGGPIVAGYRQNVAELTRKLWTRGGWPLGNWSIEDGTLPVSTSSSTPANLMGSTNFSGVTTLGTSAIDASSPGWRIDVTGRARRADFSPSGDGIPVVLAVYGSCNVAESSFIYLYDEHGNPCVVGEDVLSTTPGWVYLNGFLPAGGGTRKYDLQFWTEPGTTTTIHAASLYELTS